MTARRKAPTPCTRCGKPAVRSGLCTVHAQRADNQRPTATQRGYNDEHQRMFRHTVLERASWLCTICGKHATHADHHPKDRRQLESEGLNPNNPDHGRALCQSCHNRHTMTTQGIAAKRKTGTV